MLGSQCSPCCPSCPNVPNFSFLLQAISVRVGLSYSFTDTNTLQGGYSSSFSGEYDIPRAAGNYPRLAVSVDGKSYELEFLFFQTSVRLLVHRLQSSSSWRSPPPTGYIGMLETACYLGDGASAYVPSFAGRWGDAQFYIGDPGRPAGEFSLVCERDGQVAFAGLINELQNGLAFVFPRVFQTPQTDVLILNSCNQGAGGQAIYNETPNTGRTVRATYYGANEAYGEWNFVEELTITKLEAVFDGFTQNLLYDVASPTWRPRDSPPYMQAPGQQLFVPFISYTTPCVSLP